MSGKRYPEESKAGTVKQVVALVKLTSSTYSDQTLPTT